MGSLPAACGLSGCGTELSCPLPCGVSVPRLGSKPSSLAFQGRFLTTRPPGTLKSWEKPFFSEPAFWNPVLFIINIVNCTPRRLPLFCIVLKCFRIHFQCIKSGSLSTIHKMSGFSSIGRTGKTAPVFPCDSKPLRRAGCFSLAVLTWPLYAHSLFLVPVRFHSLLPMLWDVVAEGDLDHCKT